MAVPLSTTVVLSAANAIPAMILSPLYMLQITD